MVQKIDRVKISNMGILNTPNACVNPCVDVLLRCCVCWVKVAARWNTTVEGAIAVEKDLQFDRSLYDELRARRDFGFEQVPVCLSACLPAPQRCPTCNIRCAEYAVCPALLRAVSGFLSGFFCL